MATRDRRRFLVAQALWYFLRQDYAERELIVIDDGDDAVADVIPADPRIRYVRLPERTTSRAKHELGCRLGSGALIARWADDAWYSPRRLSAQAAALAGADACGLTGLLPISPSRRVAA